MQTTVFFSFIALAALAVATGILSVGSITLINAISQDLWKRVPAPEGDQSIYKYGQNEMHRLRRKIERYIKKLFWIYAITLSPLFIIVLTYGAVIRSSGDDGRFISAKFSLDTEALILIYKFMTDYIMPASIILVFLFAAYIVYQVTTIISGFTDRRS